MSQPDNVKPQIDNRLASVVLVHEIRLGSRTAKVWRSDPDKNYGFRAALTQFGVRFEPAESNGAEIHPVTVPMAHVLYVTHPAVKVEPGEPLPPMPTRSK